MIFSLFKRYRNWVHTKNLRIQLTAKMIHIFEEEADERQHVFLNMRADISGAKASLICPISVSFGMYSEEAVTFLHEIQKGMIAPLAIIYDDGVPWEI